MHVKITARWSAGLGPPRLASWLRHKDFPVYRNSATIRKVVGIVCTTPQKDALDHYKFTTVWGQAGKISGSSR
jgi:hypothetical protein